MDWNEENHKKFLQGLDDLIKKQNYFGTFNPTLNYGFDVNSPYNMPPPPPRKNSWAKDYIDFINDNTIEKGFFGEKPSIELKYDIFTQLTQEVDIIIDKYKNTPYLLDKVNGKLREMEKFIQVAYIDKNTIDEWINNSVTIKKLFNNGYTKNVSIIPPDPNHFPNYYKD